MKADEEKKMELIKSVEPFIFATANRFAGRGVDVDDLVQTGYEGVLRAIEKFDPEKGNTFFTYAAHWVVGLVRRVLNEEGRMIRLPEHYHQEVIIPLSRAVDRLSKDLDRKVELDDLIMDHELSKEIESSGEIAEGFYWLLNTDLDSFDIEEGAPVVYDDLDVEETVSDNIRNEKLLLAIDGNLESREADVVKARFGIPDGNYRTLAEIAGDMEITKERVRQIEAEAIEKLKRVPKVRELWAT